MSKSGRLSWSGVVFIVMGPFGRARSTGGALGAAGIGLMGIEGRGGRGSGGPERQAAKSLGRRLAAATAAHRPPCRDRRRRCVRRMVGEDPLGDPIGVGRGAKDLALVVLEDLDPGLNVACVIGNVCRAARMRSADEQSSRARLVILTVQPFLNFCAVGPFEMALVMPPSPRSVAAGRASNRPPAAPCSRR